MGVRLQAPSGPAVAAPKTAVPSYTVTVLPFSAVPTIVGLVLLVGALNVVTTGLSGALVSTVTVIADEASDTFPTASFAVAVMVCAPKAKAVDGVKLQTPADVAVAIPKTSAPSEIVTLLSASALPVITGLVLFVTVLTVVSTGAPGGVRSKVRVMGVDARDLFPAKSVAVAVITWAPSDEANFALKVQAPDVLATAVPSRVCPSETATMLLASAVPVITGFILFDVEPSVFRTGLPGGVRSTERVIGSDTKEMFPAASLAFAVIV